MKLDRQKNCIKNSLKGNEKIQLLLFVRLSVTFLLALTKCLTKQLQEGRIYFGSQFEGTYSLWCEGLAARAQAADPIVLTQKAERQCCCSACSLLCIQSRTSVYGMGAPMGLPSSGLSTNALIGTSRECFYSDLKFSQINSEDQPLHGGEKGINYYAGSTKIENYEKAAGLALFKEIVLSKLMIKKEESSFHSLLFGLVFGSILIPAKGRRWSLQTM